MNESEVQPGVRIRLIGNPERTGVIAPEPCKRAANGILMARVHFDGSHVPTWQRAGNLESVSQHPDPLEDLRNSSIHGLASLQRILTHEKLSGRLANVIYSMETSNTEFLPYQFKPVLKLLESPTNSLLIADEVGLGKTIEAGLIWTELRARSGARNLLVICPPHLREKWEMELKNRFGVRVEICKAKEVLQHLRQLRQDPNHSFAIVSSFHGLRPPANWEDQAPDANPRVALAHLLSELAAGSPPLDLVVIDEAHYMRNRENRTAELGELVTAAATHRVFLSATPIHTRNENLYNLLRLLDPDSFNSEQAFRGILEANAPLVRIRDLLLNPAGTLQQIHQQLADASINPFLHDSRVLEGIRKEIEQNPAVLATPQARSEVAYRVERVNLLGHAINRTRKRDVPGKHVERGVKTVRVKLAEPERAFYDGITELVFRYAEQHDIPAGFLFVMPQRQVASCMAAACARWAVPGNREENDFEVNPDFQNAASDKDEDHPLVSFISENVRRLGNPSELEACDTKFTMLAQTLKSYWEQNPNEKVVLFSYFRPTLHYLRRRLANERIESILLLGGMAVSKQEIVNEFRASKTIRLLLSSEVGSEGLDIEFAKVLVNYDLPWNPMVVEQRIGRLDRIGQQADQILIFNLIAEDTIDERIYDRLYMRLNLFRRALGDLEAILGPIVSELTRDLLTHRLSSEQQQDLIKRAEQALANGIRIQEELEENAAVLAAYGDYILRQVEASHHMQRWIKAGEIERYMLDFFRKRFPQTELQGVNAREHSYDLSLDNDALFDFDRFLQLRNLTGQTRLNTTQRRRLRFDNRSFLKPLAGEEVVTQSHPLVRFAAWKTRTEGLSRCVPVAVRLAPSALPDGVSPGAYVFNVQRWQVSGLREIEKLHFLAAPLGSGEPLGDRVQAEQIVEQAIALGEDWRNPELDVNLAQAAEAVARLEDLASEEFLSFEQQCIDENEDRARIQLTSIDRFECRRLQSLNEVLRTHMNMGRSSLAEATRGQIEKLKERCDLQRREIKARSRTEAEFHQICFGLIGAA
jgi:superfamily II DNA or RNA helicase